MLAALSCIVKSREEERSKQTDTLGMPRELVDRGHKVAELAHIADLAEIRAKFTSLTNELDVVELRLCALLGWVDKKSRVRDKI